MVDDPRELQESVWTRSGAKRTFDCVCVLAALPIAVPILVATALAVAASSRGPVLFIQQRVGRNGTHFPIVKFRTMEHVVSGAHHPVTTAANQRFTVVGPCLRRWKLDELPQLFNVLAGHMSLVGPRPKIPEHSRDQATLRFRPGITGAATLAFASEEKEMAGIPREMLDEYYHSVVLPAKSQLDAEYMASATFASDFRILVASVLRRWNNAIWKQIPRCEALVEHRQATLLAAEMLRSRVEAYRIRRDRELEEMAK